MTNRDKYETARAAYNVFTQQTRTVHMTWAFAEWLDTEYSDDELTYLRSLEAHRILTTPSYRRLHALEKAAGKAVAK